MISTRTSLHVPSHALTHPYVSSHILTLRPSHILSCPLASSHDLTSARPSSRIVLSHDHTNARTSSHVLLPHSLPYPRTSPHTCPTRTSHILSCRSRFLSCRSHFLSCRSSIPSCPLVALHSLTHSEHDGLVRAAIRCLIHNAIYDI